MAFDVLAIRPLCFDWIKHEKGSKNYYLKSLFVFVYFYRREPKVPELIMGHLGDEF